MITRLLCLLMAALGGMAVYGQDLWIVQGTVRDEKTLDPVVGASVVLWIQGEERKRVAITNTDTEGGYQLMYADSGTYELRFAAMGYAEHIVLITSPHSRIREVNIMLEPSEYILEEVLISSPKNPRRRSDSRVFSVADFETGRERVVEDLLKNIPGVQIGPDGTIRIGHRAIEKILVDGDDFFGSNYTVLSRNMPIYPVASIQILEQYSEDDVLRGIRQSDAVAVNLTLQDQYERRWFGNVEAGWAPFSNEKYDGKADVMNFGKRDKYYFLSNMNSVGYEPVRSVSLPLIDRTPWDGGEPHPNAIQFVNVEDAGDANIPPSRRRFNQARMGSLNTILRPSKRWKLSVVTLLDKDDIRSSRYHEERLFVHKPVSRQTYFSHRNRHLSGVGEISVRFDPRGEAVIRSQTKLEFGSGLASANQRLHENRTIDRLQSGNLRIRHESSYQHRLDERRALLVNVWGGMEDAKQYFQVISDSPLEMMLRSASLPGVQKSRHDLNWLGLKSTFLQRMGSRSLLEGCFGLSQRAERLYTAVIPKAADFTHQDSLYFQEIFGGTEYTHQLGPIALTGRLRLRALFHGVHGVDKMSHRSMVGEPGLKIDWRMKANQHLVFGFSSAYQEYDVTSMHRNYILLDGRTASKGTGKVGDTRFTTWTMRYQHGAVGGDHQFVILTYLVNYPRFLSAHHHVITHYVLSEALVVENPYVFSLHATYDYFIRPLSSNIRLDVKSTRSLSKNKINHSPLNEFLSSSHSWKLELRSGFKGVFNFHLGTLLQKTGMRLDRYTTRTFLAGEGFADLIFRIGNRLSVDLESEWHYSYPVAGISHQWSMVDVNVHYRLMEDRLTLMLVGRNLLNAQKSRSGAFGETGYSMTSTDLVPGMVLIKAMVRF